MIAYMLTYLILFSSTYFLGHFCMSMAYALGPAAITSMAAVLCAAAVVTLWKASGCLEGKHEAVWGMFAGFFLWCFFGEFLTHERILSLVEPEAMLLLLTCMMLISCLIYRKLVSVGMRFALGHFGGIWLLHAMLIHQTEVVKNHSPSLYNVSTPALCLAFIIISLLMLLKTIRARSENARLAFLLSSFLFFWTTMETLQAMDCLPDYTCYAYWTGGTASERKIVSLEKTVHKKIEQMKKRHPWKDQQAAYHAYARIKGIPSPHFIDDFAVRLDQEFKNSDQHYLDEKLFYRVMEESFAMASTSAFDRLLTACIQEFKESSGPGIPPQPQRAAYPADDTSREDVDGEIAFILERYNWDSIHTHHLAGYLLRRFSIQFLSGDDFRQRLDETMQQETTDILGEELFCRVMKEHFAATCSTVFKSLIQSHVQR